MPGPLSPGTRERRSPYGLFARLTPQRLPLGLLLSAMVALVPLSSTAAQNLRGGGGLAPAVSPPGGHDHNVSNCPAGNARTNTTTPYKTSLDFVPVTTDDSLGFHVSYSGKSSPSGGNGVAFNVGIFLFPLTDGGLLVFGSGYGDPSGPGTASNDAAYDAANVDTYVRQCLGRTPATTPIDFVSPHWHGDHINEEFLRELAILGYDVRAIWFHEDDDSFIRSYYNWTQAELAKFKTFPDAGCNVEIGSFQSTLGKIWFVGRSGHAAGAIDLILDVRDNPNDRVTVLGSEPGGNCPTPPSGIRWTHLAHGNAQVPIVGDVVPYGCGVNAAGSLFVQAGEPLLGTQITLGVDDPRGDVTGGKSFPVLFSSLTADPNIPCGTLIQSAAMARPYEVLIDPLAGNGLAAPIVGGTWMGPGSPTSIQVQIPLDPAAYGRSAYVQAALLEAGPGATLNGIMLTEALELRLDV